MHKTPSKKAVAKHMTELDLRFGISEANALVFAASKAFTRPSDRMRFIEETYDRVSIFSDDLAAVRAAIFQAVETIQHR